MTDDDFGDEAEYKYIIEQGQLEAEQFGTYEPLGTRPVLIGSAFHPARWLNPPTKVVTADMYD